MIRTIIIEDESLATTRLKRLLSKIEPQIEVLQELESLTTAISYLTRHQEELDLIFLDIHLSDGSSFEIFEHLKIDVPIIFTTAYDQYAIQAFKQNSVDYLLKPIGEEDLRNSIEKYKNIFHSNQGKSTIDYNLISQLLQPESVAYKKRFLVYVGAKIRSIKVEDIAYFYAEQGANFLVTHQGKTYDTNYTLERLSTLLEPALFYRANRKFIINIQSVAEAYQYSRNRLKIEVQPKSPFDIFVPLDRISAFKRWLSA